MQKVIVIMLLSIAMLAGCARPTPIIKPPARDADIYPGFQKTAELSVAVDQISNPDRTRQYFGVDLTKEEILPVMIVFTNHGDHGFLINPSNMLLLAGNDVIDPLPIERVQKIVKGGADLSMQETVVPPRGSYRGVLFFKVKKAGTGLYGKVERLLIDRLKMRVVVTEKDTGERIHFGPFSLSGF